MVGFDGKRASSAVNVDKTYDLLPSCRGKRLVERIEASRRTHVCQRRAERETDGILCSSNARDKIVGKSPAPTTLLRLSQSKKHTREKGTEIGNCGWYLQMGKRSENMILWPVGASVR